MKYVTIKFEALLDDGTKINTQTYLPEDYTMLMLVKDIAGYPRIVGFKSESMNTFVKIEDWQRKLNEKGK